MSEVVGFLLGGAWGRRRGDRRALQQLKNAGTVESALRVVDGHAAGLSREWMHGGWAVAPGRLALFSVAVEVAEVEDGFRLPTVRESWGVRPDAEIVTLRLPAARLEWALLPSCREAALELLQQGGERG